MENSDSESSNSKNGKTKEKSSVKKSPTKRKTKRGFAAKKCKNSPTGSEKNSNSNSNSNSKSKRRLTPLCLKDSNASDGIVGESIVDDSLQLAPSPEKSETSENKNTLNKFFKTVNSNSRKKNVKNGIKKDSNKKKAKSKSPKKSCVVFINTFVNCYILF